MHRLLVGAECCYLLHDDSGAQDDGESSCTDSFPLLSQELGRRGAIVPSLHSVSLTAIPRRLPLTHMLHQEHRWTRREGWSDLWTRRQVAPTRSPPSNSLTYQVVRRPGSLQPHQADTSTTCTCSFQACDPHFSRRLPFPPLPLASSVTTSRCLSSTHALRHPTLYPSPWPPRYRLLRSLLHYTSNRALPPRSRSRSVHRMPEVHDHRRCAGESWREEPRSRQAQTRCRAVWRGAPGRRASR